MIKIPEEAAFRLVVTEILPAFAPILEERGGVKLASPKLMLFNQKSYKQYLRNFAAFRTR